MFLESLGSAQISKLVLSGPIPAKPTAAATFTFAGKAFAPSVAEPLNIILLFDNFANEILFSTTYFENFRALGGFLVIIFTEKILPSDAALRPSNPKIAPEAKMT